LNEPRTFAIDASAFLARGDALLGHGDVASARLFYERAADAGNTQAAIRMGGTFDPAFLAKARLNGVRGDPAVALKWYKRAQELGASEAGILLMDLERK
jgi:TPR repeat protein